MNIKELELQRVEKYLFSKIPPIAKTFVLNSPKVVAYIEKWENLIIAVMNENGSINGELLGELIKEKFPNFSQWLNIPKTDFYLIDELDILLDFITKGVK